MKLDISQQFEIEQHIINGRNSEAVKFYQEATGKGYAAATSAIDKLTRDLMTDKPWLFEQKSSASSPANENPENTHDVKQSIKIGKPAIIAFIIIDTLIFFGLIYWFMFGF